MGGQTTELWIQFAKAAVLKQVKQWLAQDSRPGWDDDLPAHQQHLFDTIELLPDSHSMQSAAGNQLKLYFENNEDDEIETLMRFCLKTLPEQDAALWAASLTSQNEDLRFFWWQQHQDTYQEYDLSGVNGPAEICGTRLTQEQCFADNALKNFISVFLMKDN
ncbi:hypothetical protein [Pelagibaculum spongiae]|uniref:Uncharacterized protein n=1 Tax=Pelagibaculum spongiae TaxID=2080658 RepID=A0A2V1GS09_9GAMM|nr:hypothetical protein [Pelagibaculum spongiae]PVZ66754.1 hypothetical protein DC094_15935 [Pelagibaculum spongiae]